jgi:DNA-binding response OmpR family regulator
MTRGAKSDDSINGSVSSRAVLLVECNRDDALLFERAFRAAGFENPLHVVHTSEKAITYLEGDGEYADRARYPVPHMMVIDRNLRGTSGIGVLAWARQQPHLKASAAIMLSGQDGTEEHTLAIDLGANACHQKPASFEELQALIRRMGDFWLLGGLGVR